MASQRSAPFDAIVVGGGHNGLVAGAYLAKAGLRTLLLEKRATLGGTVETRLLADGRRAPGLFHTVGRLRPSVARELGLRGHGLTLVAPEVRAFAPQPDGRAVTLWADPARTADELRGWSAADGAAWVEFDRHVRALAAFMASLNDATPPATSGGSLADAITGLLLGRAFKKLSKDDARQLLRILPMAIADFVAESFESDPVRAAIAMRAVAFTALGAWSMGTTAALLADSAGQRRRGGRPDGLREGRPRRAGRRPRGGRARLRRRDPDRCRGGRRHHGRWPRDRRGARVRRRDRGADRRVRPGPEADAARAAAAHGAGPEPALAGRQHPAAGTGGQGQPGPGGAAHVPGGGGACGRGAPSPGPDPRGRHRDRRHGAGLRRHRNTDASPTTSFWRRRSRRSWTRRSHRTAATS